MSVIELIQTVKKGNLAKTKELLKGEIDINGHGDEQGWTPLNYASGKGDLNMVKLLLERGADVFNTGYDRRTPYEIALAAGHVEVAQLLRDMEDKIDPEQAKTSSQRIPRYCKAYYLEYLRQFPEWVENEVNYKEENKNRGTVDKSEPLPDNQVVFLHMDFTVTLSIWHNDKVIFDKVTDNWKTFCSEVLKFKAPDGYNVAV